jgi:hypothetical protein
VVTTTRRQLCAGAPVGGGGCSRWDCVGRTRNPLLDTGLLSFGGEESFVAWGALWEGALGALHGKLCWEAHRRLGSSGRMYRAASQHALHLPYDRSVSTWAALAGAAGVLTTTRVGVPTAAAGAWVGTAAAATSRVGGDPHRALAPTRVAAGLRGFAAGHGLDGLVAPSPKKLDQVVDLQALQSETPEHVRHVWAEVLPAQLHILLCASIGF